MSILSSPVSESMTPLDRLVSALRSSWLPLALLLIALSTVFVFGGDRGSFYRGVDHNWISSEHLAIAVNLSPEHGFQQFQHRFMDEGGAVRYQPHNRFPIGGYLIMNLATLPFGESPSARLTAARILMLLFFAAAVVLAYHSLCRLVSNRWIALTATLLSFSSYYLLYYNDMTANEGMIDLFAVMSTFHGMVVFVQEGRFRQLLIKTCIALLLGWHVLALLLPFVIFGLASEILRARSAAADSTHSVISSRVIAPTLIRSRYLLLGIVALGFGLSVLTSNFAMEYVALDGETPLTELPSFQSMLRRTGVDSDFNADFATQLAWNPFLEGQLRRILRGFIPYWLIARVGIIESETLQLEFRDEIVTPVTDPNFARLATWLSESPGIVLAVLLSAASLIGSIFVRPRILFLTLASFGFFWALPTRNNTAFHDFEAIYYIGLPLVFFTIVLLLARRLTKRDGIIVVVAVVAALLFALSSFQMRHVGHNAESARTMKAAAQDLRAVRELTEGEIVTVLNLGGSYKWFFNRAAHAMNYYLNSSIIEYSSLPLAAHPGFVVMRERVDTDALITPQNQHFFLYDAPSLPPDLLAWYRSTYRSIASTEPIVREKFDVYLDDGKVYYLKEPCERSDISPIFFLHVFPEDLDDLSDQQKPHGFAHLDFFAHERGVRFDGKCLLHIDLPKYDIAGFRTGRIDRDGSGWMVAHVLQGPKLISAYPSIVSTEPAARSEFDLYLDGGNLYYVKEPCAIEDVQAGFFLHIVPADLGDLPGYRKQHGFDNLDFGFDVRGVLFDGKCAASVDLPQYAIARITTGQYDGVDRIWEVEFAPEARE